MNKLALFLGLCLIGCAIAADTTPCLSKSMSQFGRYIEQEDFYYWNNCATAAKAYFDQDLTSTSNILSSDFYRCAAYTSSDTRKKCESDYNLAGLTTILQNFYSCVVDYQNKLQSSCTHTSTCDSQANLCDYNHVKEGNTISEILAYSADITYTFKSFISDLSFGLNSSQCKDIQTNCNTFSKGWQPICIAVYQQKCLDDFLKQNYSTDVSYLTYACQLNAASFGFLIKYSLFALLVMFAF